MILLFIYAALALVARRLTAGSAAAPSVGRKLRSLGHVVCCNFIQNIVHCRNSRFPKTAI